MTCKSGSANPQFANPRVSGVISPHSARFCATCAAPLFVGEAANFCSVCGAPQPGVSHVLAPGSPGWTPPRSLREVMPP